MDLFNQANASIILEKRIPAINEREKLKLVHSDMKTKYKLKS